MAVRRERVILELDDRFSTKMAKAAQQTLLLDKALDRLDGSAVKVQKPLHESAVETDRVAVASRKAGPEIDRLSGRLRLFADAAAILGPSLAPIGAVAVPAVTGLASQLGFAAIGAGSLVVAFQGVGDALKAVNQAALDPTAANLEKAQAAMAGIGPDAAAFVARFQELRPVLGDIRDSAAAGWFPGLTEAMDSFERIGPEVGDLFEKIGEVGGNLVADGTKAFAGPEWADFRAFIATEAPKALDDLGRTVGNLIGGLARLWQAFAPLNSDFSTWMLNASRDFHAWAEGLSQTQGFADFIDYIRTNGPRVADALKAVGDAVLQIIEAVAPLGGPSLKIIEAFANVISAIADSDIGTPIFGGIAALALLNRTLQATAALQTRLTGSTALSGGLAAGGLIGGGRAGVVGVREYTKALVAIPTAADRARLSTAKLADAEAKRQATLRRGNAMMGKTAGIVGGLALATSGLADGMGVTNTASLAMMGTMAGPWGMAIGGATGAVLDWTKANDGLGDSIKQAQDAIDSGSIDALTTAIQRLKEESAALADRQTVSGVGDLASDLFSPGAWKQMLSDDWAGLTGGATDAEKVAEAAGRAQAELNKVLQEQAGDHARSRSLQKMQQDLTEIRDGAQQTADSFLGLGESLNDSKVSLGEWIAQMREQAGALNAFTTNAETAAKRGLRDGLVAELRAAGPEGALRMKELADGTDAEIRRANAAWLAGQRAAERYVKSVAAGSKETIRNIQIAGDAYKSLPEDVKTEIRAYGIPETEAAVNDLVKRYELTEAERRALITLMDNASGPIQNVLALLRSVKDKKVTITTYLNTIRTSKAPKGTSTDNTPNILTDPVKRARGGLVTGPGTTTSDSIPALVSNREYVVKAAAVDKYGVSFFDQVNAMRFREGGYVAPRVQPRQHAGSSSYATTVAVDLSPLERRLASVESAIHANTADRGAQTGKQTKASRYGASAAARSWPRGVS